MTTKKTPHIQQLPADSSDAQVQQAAPLRTIWNTSCGGYPASSLIAAAGEGKTSAASPKKTTKARAKAL